MRTTTTGRTATIAAMLTPPKVARALTIVKCKSMGDSQPHTKLNKMSRPKKFVPYTHEELGIPNSLEIGGFKISIIFDPSISNAVINEDANVTARLLNPIWKTGVLGVADQAAGVIKLWTGNKIYKPSRQRIMFVFLEEIEHWIFYCMQLQPKNLEQNVWLHANEHVVVSHTILLLQVLKQLEGVKFSDL